MKNFIYIVPLSLLLGGCVGTFVLQRDVDTSAPYPSLHTVPDRPPKIDFTKSDAELEDFEADFAKKNELNESIRNSTPRVTKPEF